eukprot:3297220-Rhodomonas_salina.3
MAGWLGSAAPASRTPGKFFLPSAATDVRPSVAQEGCCSAASEGVWPSDGAWSAGVRGQAGGH